MSAQRQPVATSQPLFSSTPMPASQLASRRLPSLLWLCIIAGAFLIVGLSSITTVEGEWLSPPAGQTLTLGGIQTIGQVLDVSRPDLVGVMFQVNAPSQAPGVAMELTVRLRYVVGPPIDLVSQRVVVNPAEDSLVTARFSPIDTEHSQGRASKKFVLLIDIPELTPGTGPTIVVQERPQAQGGLIVDGSPKANLDLVVAPLYQRRWVDRIWPISAMASGKPGLLGWPPLYPLLAYCYLVILSMALAAIRRALPPKG